MEKSRCFSYLFVCGQTDHEIVSGQPMNSTKTYHISPNNLLTVGIYLKQVQELKTRQCVSIGIQQAWLRDSGSL